MAKIVFLGAGSTVFAKNVLGDCMWTPALQNSDISLYDIDAVRLEQSLQLLEALNQKINNGRANISAHLGPDNRKTALNGADYVINAIQVGGFEPSTVIDFEVPKKYGLRQTIGDTLGIGGIFRGLRTIPVMLEIARDMEALCPDAWLLNYTNPMAIVTGAVLLGSKIKTVGLCHSVQVVCRNLFEGLGLFDDYDLKNLRFQVAGINHMAWLLELRDANGKDLYPEIKRLAEHKLKEWRKAPKDKKSHDMVRMEMMLRFGYYITESSEHNAEYMPYWIKNQYPELIEEYNIPLDEYPRRCVEQIKHWEKQSLDLLNDDKVHHEKRTSEYASYIMEAMETNNGLSIGGNVLNKGMITNLPNKCVVEVPCLVDRNGIQGCFVGELPEQCAALNRTSINVQNLTIKAALTGKREHIYHAAMLDPHTAAELTLDQIHDLCDDLIEAHGSMLPVYH
jgi:alpha-galactosidase